MKNKAQDWVTFSGTVDKTAHIKPPAKYGLIPDLGTTNLSGGGSRWSGTAGKEFSTVADKLARNSTAYGEQETSNAIQAGKI